MFNSSDFPSLFLFALNITAPVFTILFLGFFLNKIQLINDEFIRIASKLVFNVALPILLYTSVASRDFSQLINLTDIGLLLSTSILIFIVASILAKQVVLSYRDTGVFVQGAFRGNLMILGMAFCANAYGENGVAVAALPMAIVVVFYNVLSVYTLNASLGNANRNWTTTLKEIAKNPLIIAIAIGLTVNALQLKMPNLVDNTTNYLAQLTLPLALLCIGGTLNLKQLKQSRAATLTATLIKIVATPVLLIILSLVFVPLDKTHMGVLFLLASSPSAAAGFIMVKALNGNSDLAAKIIVLTTLGSLFTVTGGLVLLGMANLI